MTIAEIRKAFKFEVPSEEVFVKETNRTETHYNDLYVQWLEKKLIEFLTP